MAQLLVTLLFTGLLVLAARVIFHELTRPLVNRPACWDDAVYDALCDGRAAPLVSPVMARRSSPRPVQRQSVPSLTLAAAA